MIISYCLILEHIPQNEALVKLFCAFEKFGIKCQSLNISTMFFYKHYLLLFCESQYRTIDGILKLIYIHRNLILTLRCRIRTH